MARYLIKDAAGAVVDSIICAPEQIADFLEPGQSADMTCPHDKTDAQALAVLRAERDRRLAACDWTLTPDAPTDKVAWTGYRQALRDLPETVSDPHAPDWPRPPA